MHKITLIRNTFPTNSEIDISPLLDNIKLSETTLFDFLSTLSDKSQLIQKTYGISQDSATQYLADTSHHISSLIADYDKKRLSLVKQTRNLPENLKYSYEVNADLGVTKILDDIGFHNAILNIDQQNVQTLIDKLNLVMVPYTPQTKKLLSLDKKTLRNFEHRLSYPSDEKGLFLIPLSNLSLKTILSMHSDDIERIIVPTSFRDKWDTFLFQVPIFQDLYDNIRDVKQDISTLNDKFNLLEKRISENFSKQNKINQFISENLNSIVDRVNLLTPRVYNLTGEDKNRFVSRVDYSDPQYQTSSEGYGEILFHDAYDEPVYSHYMPVVTTWYPTKNFFVLGEVPYDLHHINSPKPLLSIDTETLQLTKTTMMVNSEFNKFAILMSQNKSSDNYNFLKICNENLSVLSNAVLQEQVQFNVIEQDIKAKKPSSKSPSI